MPSGISKETCKANCELPQCVEAKVKAHKGKTVKHSKIIPIIKCLTKVLEGSLSFVSSGNLKTAFDMEKNDVDTADICLALLNLDREAIKSDLEQDRMGPAFSKIVYRVNPYLPDGVKVKTYKEFSSLNACEETKIQIRDFCLLVISACNRIEDKLTSNYYQTGKNHYVEILKRRYKSNWGDQGKSIEVKTEDKNADTEITITIKEA